MILTGHEITRQRNAGKITIEPFHPDQVNPNSYNYRLGTKLLVSDRMDESGKPVFKEQTIPEDGYILQNHGFALGSTSETIGSSDYAMSLIGRSSIGRLGLFLQISANLGHTTSTHKWTLELKAVKAIRIYPNMIIGQVSFWTNEGSVSPYLGAYAKASQPTESRVKFHQTRGTKREFR